jgi:hypothetical protein
MVNAISNVAFRYQDSPQQADEWFSAWPHADRLPRRIGVQIRTLTTAWPEIIVGVLPAVGPNTASGAGGAAGPTIGPF